MRYRHVSYRYWAVMQPPGFLDRRPWSHELIHPAPAHWQPSADLFETADALVLRVELAGVPEEHIVIALYEDALVVEGERRWTPVESEARFHRAQIHYGPFRLELSLPPRVDRAGIRAQCDAGLLTVTLPWANRGDA